MYTDILVTLNRLLSGKAGKVTHFDALFFKGYSLQVISFLISSASMHV